MAKNMTRKGLALGVGVALIASTVALPASAVVSDSDVSLLPRTGTEYGMVLDNVYDLKSDVSLDAVAGSGNLKFLVTDPDKEVLFDYDEDTADDATGRTELTTIANISSAGAGAAAQVGVASNVVTITDADNPYGNLAVGDVVTITGLDSTNWGDAYTSTVVLTAAAAGSISFKLTKANLTAEATTAGAIDEISNNVGLDDRATVAAGSLGGGMTGIAIVTRETDGSFVVNTGDDDTANTDVLRLVSTSTDTHTVTVTAWVDENGNGSIDVTEDSSSTRTITFYKWADSGYTLELDIAAGATSWNGTVKFNAAINAAQITDGRITIGVGRVALGAIQDAASTTTVSSGAFTAGEAAQWNSVKKYWELENGSGTAGVSQVYAAIANVSTATAATLAVTGATAPALDTFVLADTDNPYGFYAVGDILKVTTAIADGDSTIPVGEYTVTAVEVGKLTFQGDTSVATDTADNTSAGAFSVEKFTTGVTYAAQILVDGTRLGNPTYKALSSADSDSVGAASVALSQNVKAGSDFLIRSKTTSAISISSAITKGGKAVAAGVKATVRVTRNSLDSTAGAISTITAGGKTLTHATSDGYIEFEATTNADGKVVFDLTNSKGTTGDSVSVTVKQSGITSTSKTFVWGVPTAASTVLGVDYSSVSILKGGVATLKFTVVDDFGKPLAGDYRLLVTYYDKVGGSSKTAQALVSNGTATFSVTDTSTSNGSYTIDTTLQELNASLAWANYGSPETTSTTVYVVGDTTATAVGATATVTTASGTAAAVETVAGAAVDARYDANVALDSVPAYSAAEKYTVAGQVTGANNQAISAARVTLSGSGLLFKIGNLYTIGSIEAVADASGNYSGVEVRSNKSGNQTLTVTSGTASKTVTLSFDAPAETAGTVVSLANTASTAAPGSTFQVSATISDKFGNAVATSGSKVSVKYSGPGLTIPSTLPADADSTGSIKFAVLLGSNDVGTATVTVTYAGKNGTVAETSSNDDVVVTKTITIGLPEAVANIGSFSGRVAVRVENAKGSDVSVKIGKQWYKFVAKNNNYLQSWKSRKGTSVAVSVYVDGDLQNVQTITVK